MEIKINNERYPTEPINSWGKMKELRQDRFRQTWEAIHQGKPIIQGAIEFFPAYFAGIGDFASANFGPYFSLLMHDPKVAIRVFEATEAAGYGRDLCSTTRGYLGQMLTGMSFTAPNGEKMKPWMVFQILGCHSLGKTGQMFAQANDIPYFIIDFPGRDDETARHYLKAELAEGIEQLEKITGREYNDEALIEGIKNEWTTACLMARICEYMKNIPAPYDVSQMYSLRSIYVTQRHQPGCMAFYRELLDETRYRTERGISARGREKVRLQHEGVPPFTHIEILRYPVQWGGIFAASGTMMIGLYNTDLETGAAFPAPFLEERGKEIRTREDALDLICDQHLHYGRRFWDPYRGRQNTLWRHNAFRCQGMILHLDKGCTGAQQGIMENKVWFEEHGIPVTTYESSQADLRDFDQAQIYDRLDAFMESLGLTRLESWGGVEVAEVDDEAIPR